MARNIDDMIVPEKRRSIRDIPIPEGRKRVERYSTAPSDHAPIHQNPPHTFEDITPPPQTPPTPISQAREVFNKPFQPIAPKKKRSKGLWIAAGVSVVIMIFAILSLFGGATLAYVPKSSPVSFGTASTSTETFRAFKSGNAEENLLYSVVKFSKDKSLSVPVTGEAEVSRKASGTIVVYNNFSSEPQRLIENTRFESPDGLIYRIQDAITIPGRQTVSGAVQPGSIEVMVYADAGGEEYNIGLVDFTVPGLANTPRATSVYARSKTPMTGGFVGMEKSMSEEDRVRARISLETALREELALETREQVPEEFVLFPELSSVTFEELPQTVSEVPDNVNLNLRAHFSGIIFKAVDFATFLSRDKINLSPNESVMFQDIESLNVSFGDISSPDLLLVEEIDFSVSGQGTAVWLTDETQLMSDILGRSKDEIPDILSNYPTIVSASTTISPFWKMSYPDDAKSVTIKKLPVQ